MAQQVGSTSGTAPAVCETEDLETEDLETEVAPGGNPG